MTARISDEVLTKELNRVTELLGYPPSYEDMRTHGNIGPATLRRRYGSWENVKRLTGWIPDYELYSPEKISPVDGGWLSGMIDGEGCFRIQKASKSSKERNISSYSPQFNMTLRTDDIYALKEVMRIIGTSKSSIHIDNREWDKAQGGNANPAFKLFVRDIPTLGLHLVPLLKLYPLRSKKKFELIIFEISIDMLLSKWKAGRKNKKYENGEKDLLERCRNALSELKNFESDFDEIIDKYQLADYIQP